MSASAILTTISAPATAANRPDYSGISPICAPSAIGRNSGPVRDQSAGNPDARAATTTAATASGILCASRRSAKAWHRAATTAACDRHDHQADDGGEADGDGGDRLRIDTSGGPCLAGHERVDVSDRELIERGGV